MSDALFLLPIEQQLTPSLSLRKKEGLTFAVIDHPKAKGVISLQGAQLLAWQPAGENPVIWLSEATHFEPGVAIRGGIPICWPWFGKAGTPSHGFARNEQWRLTAHDESEECVWLTFTLNDSETTRKVWPNAFSLIARIKLGETCELELESHGDYAVTAALHSYFQVGDISQVSVSGLGESYIDKLADADVTAERSTMRFSGPVDRIYYQPQAFSTISDPVLKRTIEIHHRNAPDVVVWNPGAEGAASMTDMSAEGYKTMACVETGCVSQPAIVRSDKPHYLSVAIRCHKEAL